MAFLGRRQPIPAKVLRPKVLSTAGESALSVATGVFSTGTGAAGTRIPVTVIDPNTGVGFTPKVVIFLWSGRTGVGQSEQDHKFGMGYMVSASDRGGVTSQSDHGPTSSATDTVTFDDSCICLMTTAGAADGKADFESFDANGFTVVIDDAFTENYLVSYLALGGTDITNVASQTVTITASTTGNQSVTGYGFQPDCAIVFGGRSATINTAVVASSFSIGVVDQALNNYVVCGRAADAAGTSSTDSYSRAGECFARASTSPAVSVRASITAWGADGFTWNTAEVDAANYVIRVLGIKGVLNQAGFIATRTDTTEASVTGLANPVKALMFISQCKAQSAADTATNNDERSVGFATAAAQRTCAGIMDKHNAADMDIGVAQYTDAIYVHQSQDATIVVSGLMDIVSLNSDGFTYVMDDADPSAMFVPYLAFQQAAAAAAVAFNPAWVTQNPVLIGGGVF